MGYIDKLPTITNLPITRTKVTANRINMYFDDGTTCSYSKDDLLNILARNLI